MAKVLIPLAMGFEEIEALSLVDILRRADIEVVIAGMNDGIITGAHGVKIKPDMRFEKDKFSSFDMIVLPGGLPGAEHLAKNEELKSLLKEFDKKGKFLAAICAAPWALSEAGVLKNKYTCYPSFENTIKKDGYKADQDVVKDENILTSRGPATAMKFALEVVKTLCGEEKYKEIKSGLLA